MSRPGGTSSARPLGLMMATALVVGNMIGSGVYLLPAALAPYGWNVIPAWGLTIAGGLAIATVFGGLARARPQAGGPYAYSQAAFGPGIGFFVAWVYWVSLFIGNAAIAIAVVSYMSAFAPAIATNAPLSTGIAILLVWSMTALNLRGTAAAGRFQLVTTILKILPLIAVVLIAAMAAPAGGLILPDAAHPPITLAAISTAATLTLWALLGVESATVPAAKVADPERTIPRATIGGTALTGIIYLFACTAVILLLSPMQAAQSAAPFADLIGRYWGSKAGHVVALFAMISALGALNGWVLLQGEMPAAMAMGGVFPRGLARLSARGVPMRAHILSSSLATIVLLFNASKTTVALFTFVALLATTASLVMYLVVALAALKLGGVARPIAVAAGVYAVWALYGAGLEANIWGLVLLACGIPMWWGMRNANPLRGEKVITHDSSS